MSDSVAAKRTQLRNVRFVATALLAAMLALLFFSTRYMAAVPWLHWVRALAEAGAVGAAADWYAVVALFRHPLGLPIPHTAIIPRNKDRIGESLGEFVEQNFLTPENILRRLENHNIARAVGQWLAEPRNRSTVAEAVCDIIRALLKAGSDKDLQRLLDRMLSPLLMRLDVSRAAGHLLDHFIGGERHQALLDRALATLEDWLRQNQGLIKAKFSEASLYTPGFLDTFIVGKFIDGIIALLHDVAGNPQHELRARFDTAAHKLTDDLKTSVAFRRHGRSLMRDLILHVRNRDYYGALWNEIQTRAQADLSSERSMLREHVAAGLDALGREMLADPVVQQKLNTWWLEVVREVTLRFRHEVSALIADVVKSWDRDDVSRRVELEIGKDLQFIRINGTLVGGAVGLLLHAAILLLR